MGLVAANLRWKRRVVGFVGDIYFFFCGEEGITDDFLMGDEEFLQMSMVL